MDSGGRNHRYALAKTSLGSTLSSGGLRQVSFYRARGEKDPWRDGPKEGGWGNENKKPLIRRLKRQDVNHRRELFKSKVLRFPVILCKINSSRAN